MLQNQNFSAEQEPNEGSDLSYLMQPAYYVGVLKRRWLLFLIPFLLVLSAGAAGVFLWPPTYLSEGKILVQSQLIPTELVRPTVTNAAQERLQVIEQRTMTRDNLIAIADKFNLYPTQRSLMSPTQIVDRMKESIKIEPVARALAFTGSSQNPTIIFKVGFEADNPLIASKVANELVTRILDLDLRDRTSRATDTTKFLSREVARLQGESNAIDAKLTQAKMSLGRPSGPRAGTVDQAAAQLAQLRAELAEKSAIYSDRNFQIQTLKRQIEALEKVTPAPAHSPSAPDTQFAPADLDTLETQQKSIQINLEAATSKLAAARLGETLERDQQSEKLEVIEQPSIPRDPIRPNRPKFLGLVAILSLMMGGGAALGRELLDRSIRRRSDLFSLFEHDIIISIPYMYTENELRKRRRRLLFIIAVMIVVLAAGAAAAYFFMPPLDLIIAKARVGLFK